MGSVSGGELYSLGEWFQSRERVQQVGELLFQGKGAPFQLLTAWPVEIVLYSQKSEQ